MNLLLHPTVVKPTRRLQISIVRNSTAMSGGKRRIRRRKVNIVTRSGNKINLKGVERNPPIKAPSVRNTKSRVKPSPTELTTGFTTPKRIAADIDDRDDIDSTSDIEDRTVYADTDCFDGGTDDDSEREKSQCKSTVSFADMDEIKDYDVDSPVVAENEIQASGGASSNAKEEASNEVDISSQQDKDHRPHKHTKFREYWSQHSRFRDNSNSSSWFKGICPCV
jgi:hypothetical protein